MAKLIPERLAAFANLAWSYMTRERLSSYDNYLNGFYICWIFRWPVEFFCLFVLLGFLLRKGCVNCPMKPCTFATCDGKSFKMVYLTMKILLWIIPCGNWREGWTALRYSLNQPETYFAQETDNTTLRYF